MWVGVDGGRLSGDWRCVSAFESAWEEVCRGLLEPGVSSEWHQDDGAWGLSMCPVSEPVGLRRFSGFSLAPGFIPVIPDEYAIEPIHGFWLGKPLKRLQLHQSANTALKRGANARPLKRQSPTGCLR